MLSKAGCGGGGRPGKQPPNLCRVLPVFGWVEWGVCRVWLREAWRRAAVGLHLVSKALGPGGSWISNQPEEKALQTLWPLAETPERPGLCHQVISRLKSFLDSPGLSGKRAKNVILTSPMSVSYCHYSQGLSPGYPSWLRHSPCYMESDWIKKQSPAKRIFREVTPLLHYTYHHTFVQTHTMYSIESEP